MSSRIRPCYQNLSQYSQNGYLPINAPVIVETEPQIFDQFTPRKFSQALYKADMKKYNAGQNNIIKKNTGYVSYSDISCNSDDDQYMVQNNIQSNNSTPTQNITTHIPGFNEVGVRRNY